MRFQRNCFSGIVSISCTRNSSDEYHHFNVRTNKTHRLLFFTILNHCGSKSDLLRLVNNDSSISEDERQKASNWFYASMRLALIRPSVVVDIQVQVMNDNQVR